MQSLLIQTLHERGFIHQATDLDALDELCAGGPITAYIGFDLTAESLHVGSLIQIMLLRWLAETRNHPIALLGEATTRIGDPTGKDKARPVLTDRELALNWQGINANLHDLVAKFASQKGSHLAVWTNIEWFGGMKMMEYLQEFGPHFSVNRMLTFDSVQERLNKQDHMSFLEFNYMLLQAIDFLQLYREKNCVLQLGGSDQWGNIVNGVELVRRVDQRQVFGLTTPLLTNAAGEKMGKTANGAVWLDGKKTPPFDFYQFWRNVEDEKVEQFLKLFTTVPLDVIDEMIKHSINWAKVQLALEVTKMVHGELAAQEAHRAAEAIMKGEIPTTGTPEISLSESEIIGLTVGQLFVKAGLCSSGGDAERLASQNGLRINNKPVLDTRAPVEPDFHWPNGMVWLQKGKKTIVLVYVVSDE